MIRGDRTRYTFKKTRGLDERSILPKYFLNFRLGFKISRAFRVSKVFADAQFFIFLSERIHNACIQRANFLSGVTGYKYTMIFEHDNFGNATVIIFILINTPVQFHAECITGIDVLYPKSLRKKSFAHRFSIFGTSHTIDQKGVGMNHEFSFENIVERGFDRGPACIIEYGFTHEVFDQFLAGMRFCRSFDIIEFINLGPVQGYKSFLF